MRSTKLAATFAVVVLLATSCLRFEGDITITDDGSGRFDVLTALNVDALGDALGSLGGLGEVAGGTDEICDSFAEDGLVDDSVPEGADVSPFEEDGFCGVRLGYDLPASTDHTAELGQLLDNTVELRQEGDSWIFSAPLDLAELEEAQSGTPDVLVDQLFEEATFRWTVQLPGTAVEGKNNADQVDGGTFTWNVDLQDPPAAFFAQTRGDGIDSSNGDTSAASGSGNSDSDDSDSEDGGSNLGVILGIVAGLALLAGLAWFILNRRATDTAATTATATTNAATTPAPATATPSVGTVGTVTTPQAYPPPPASHLATPTGHARLADPPATADVPAIQTTPLAPPVADEPAAVEIETPQPADSGMVFDETLGAWTIMDPVRGRLAHDPQSDEWRSV